MKQETAFEEQPIFVASKPSLYTMDYEDLVHWLKERGYATFTADQIFQWVYKKHAHSFDSMTNLSKALRRELDESFSLTLPPIVSQQQDPADLTVKVLFQLEDGERIESVVMPHYSEKLTTHFKSGKIEAKEEAKEYTVCISTQVGCMYACRFCASGQSGLKRNLEAGEIVGQIMGFLHEGYPVTRVVFMGSGEPLHNFDQVKKSIDLLTHKKGLNFSSRKITISTVGLVPEMYRLAQEEWKVKLAISLHATTDQRRAELIPLARVYQLDQLIDALRYYQRLNSRRITFEYLMLHGINDHKNDARRMKNLTEGLIAHVNLIPYNSVEKSPFQSPSHNAMQHFKKMLHHEGLDATVRYSRGGNIDAACGQLRLRYDE